MHDIDSEAKFDHQKTLSPFIGFHWEVYFLLPPVIFKTCSLHLVDDLHDH